MYQITRLTFLKWPTPPSGQQMFAWSGCTLYPSGSPFLGQPVKIGCWYCFTAVSRHDPAGEFIDLYMNGIWINTYPWSLSCTGSCGPLDLLIGKGSFNGFTTWFDGEIDDIQICRNAMNQNDVQQYFSCPCPPNTACGNGNPPPPPLPCTNTIDDIDIVGSLSKPFKRSYFVTTSPASFGNIRWAVNGTLVATLSSTSTFSYTFPSAGNYTVCAYLFDPASGTDCDTLCFETCFTQMGLKPRPQEKQLMPQMPHIGAVYPNPTSQELSLPVQGYSGPISLQVSNTEGKVLLHQAYTIKATDPAIKISTAKLLPGSYLLQITAGAVGDQQKFIKQ